MRIRIIKRGSRNRLACIRSDGTSVVADLGPNLPHHDLAHMVVERAFALSDGFFGNIARGFTPQQLSDKAVIRSLGNGPYRAEVLARALGSVHTGACDAEQFEGLVNAELSPLRLKGMQIPRRTVEALMSEYRHLISNYRALRAGESMEIIFETPEVPTLQSDASLARSRELYVASHSARSRRAQCDRSASAPNPRCRTAYRNRPARERR